MNEKHPDAQNPNQLPINDEAIKSNQINQITQLNKRIKIKTCRRLAIVSTVAVLLIPTS